MNNEEFTERVRKKIEELREKGSDYDENRAEALEMLFDYLDSHQFGDKETVDLELDDLSTLDTTSTQRFFREMVDGGVFDINCRQIFERFFIGDWDFFAGYEARKLAEAWEIMRQIKEEE